MSQVGFDTQFYTQSLPKLKNWPLTQNIGRDMYIFSKSANFLAETQKVQYLSQFLYTGVQVFSCEANYKQLWVKRHSFI